MSNLNIVIAFIAGLASFLSPCCLPLVPSYLAQLAGPSVLEADRRPTVGRMHSVDSVVALLPAWSRRAPLLHALAFVTGFSVIFIALGATASVLGGFLKSHQLQLSEIGGIVLIGMGLHYAGILRIGVLQREGRAHWRPAARSYPASFAIGVIYALGWTPCIGPVLTGILVLAAQSGTLAGGIGLLMAYTVGLGVPFLLCGVAFARISPLLARLRPHLGTIERVTGLVMVVMGIIIFNGWIIYLNAWFYRLGVRGI